MVIGDSFGILQTREDDLSKNLVAFNCVIYYQVLEAVLTRTQEELSKKEEVTSVATGSSGCMHTLHILHIITEPVAMKCPLSVS